MRGNSPAGDLRADPIGSNMRGRSMRPRRGAWRHATLIGSVALALGFAAAPALADDTSVSEVMFKLPNRAAVDTLNHMGADLTESVTPGPDGSVYVEAVVTDEEKAIYQAMGFEPVATVADEST